MRTRLGTITRRRFLALTAGLAASCLAGCVPARPTVAPATSVAGAAASQAMPSPTAQAQPPTAEPTPPAAPEPTTPPPTAAATAQTQPTAPPTATNAPTQQPSAPATTAAPAATAAPKPAPTSAKPIVAIARCEDYGVERVEAVVRNLVAQCGGLEAVVKPGATVVIKPNFTAGGRTPTGDGLANILTYTTHPDVTRAIALLAKEAGAGRIILVEGWGLDVWALNGYEGWMKELSVEALDLDDPAPGKEFANIQVPNPLALSALWLHETIAKADVLISVPKIKCHASCGITLSIKNIFGCTPLPKYQLKPSDTYRSAMHQGDWHDRLPRILIDILKIRPIDFAVVDAISTIDQGEGPWNDNPPLIAIRTVRPGLLLAGRNPVALDAVGVAVMGFDATAADYTTPFNSGLNHIALAAQQGLGTNRLDEIEVRGLSVAEARFPFSACPQARRDGAQQMHVALVKAYRNEA